MPWPTRGARTAGVLAGYLADLAFGDPARGHPVAGFGGAAAALERVSYRDTKIAGAVHTAVAVGAARYRRLPSPPPPPGWHSVAAR